MSVEAEKLLVCCPQRAIAEPSCRVPCDAQPARHSHDRPLSRAYDTPLHPFASITFDRQVPQVSGQLSFLSGPEGGGIARSSRPGAGVSLWRASASLRHHRHPRFPVRKCMLGARAFWLQAWTAPAGLAALGAVRRQLRYRPNAPQPAVRNDNQASASCFRGGGGGGDRTSSRWL